MAKRKRVATGGNGSSEPEPEFEPVRSINWVDIPLTGCPNPEKILDLTRALLRLGRSGAGDPLDDERAMSLVGASNNWLASCSYRINV